MTKLTATFLYRPETDPFQVLEEIRRLGILRRQKVYKDCFLYLDTFDWQLYSKGWVCMRRGVDHYTFSDFAGSKIHEGIGPQSAVPLGREFLMTSLGKGLESLLGIRALLPCLEAERKKQFYHLLNKDEKIILRLCVEQNQSSWDGLRLQTGGCVRIYGLRGYEKKFHRLRRMLLAEGFVEGCTENLFLQQGLAVRERFPLDYSSKLNIRLDGRETIAEAAQAIFLHLEEDMVRNIAGILADYDSEFLHDFRVAQRRSRSLLSTYKKMVPEDEYLTMQNGFKKIGGLTGPVRDLDVYLLEQENYQAMLPVALHQGLKEFFTILQTTREQEFEKLRQGLQASEYHQFMSQWLDFVRQRFCSLTGSRGKQPCRRAAVKFIRKRLEKILHAGNSINEQSPDQELHSLRIQCKKLRYLLEFYRSLFSEQSMKACLLHLKKLQNNLGSFNDLSVQQEMLATHHDQQSARSKKNLHIAAALGGLITHLQNDQQRVRKKFAKTYANFATDKHKALFHDMLTAADVQGKKGEGK